MFSPIYQEEAPYCPVLVRIKSDEIKKMQNGQEFLLQVWSKKGKMIFEKGLDRPVVNWNISTNKFLWQEEPASSTFYLLLLPKKGEQERAYVYEVTLPDDSLDERGVTKLDHKNNLIIPEDNMQEFPVDQSHGADEDKDKDQDDSFHQGKSFIDRTPD
jgi:hypothetical protein